MRRSHIRGLALTAAAALLLAGCGNDQAQQADETSAPDESTATDQPEGGQTDGEQPDADALEDLMGGTEGMEDPNEDVEDGLYRGVGVVLPVPEGWTLNQQAFAQGVVAAVSEDQTQQLTARAVDTAAMEASGQDMALDSLVAGVKDSVEQEPEVDEEVELEGADRAHRLTYLDIPGPQEGAPSSSATIVVAEGGDGLVGEFVFSATTDSYDDAVTSQLLDQAGFDPNSEPPAPPQPQQQPAPQDGGQGGGATDGTEDATDEGTEGAPSDDASTPAG